MDGFGGNLGVRLRDELSRGQFVHRLRHKLTLHLTAGRLWWLMRMRPARKTAFLYGKGDTEENLLVTALALTRSYNGRVVLGARDRALVQGMLHALAPVVAGSDPARIELVGTSQSELLRWHSESELVLTSHRVLRGPRSHGRRLHAYVSHGVGPKTDLNFPSTETVFVTACSIWTEQILRNMHLQADTPALTGFPRLDVQEHAKQRDRRELAGLGLDPDKKLLVWAPTYKSISFYGDHMWNEGLPVSRIAESREFQTFTRRLNEHAATIEFVCKPHPLEAEAFRSLGFTVLTNDDLWHRAGITAYTFFGHADALVTDYSSIWVDFLRTRRSLGIATFDLDTFLAGDRGFMEPDFAELVSGLRIDDPNQLDQFLTSVTAGEVFAEAELTALRTRIGFVDSEHYTDDLLRELRDVGLARHHYDFGLNA